MAPSPLARLGCWASIKQIIFAVILPEKQDFMVGTTETSVTRTWYKFCEHSFYFISRGIIRKFLESHYVFLKLFV
jgi:hypothetical protein